MLILGETGNGTCLVELSCPVCPMWVRKPWLRLTYYGIDCSTLSGCRAGAAPSAVSKAPGPCSMVCIFFMCSPGFVAQLQMQKKSKALARFRKMQQRPALLVLLPGATQTTMQIPTVLRGLSYLPCFVF